MFRRLQRLLICLSHKRTVAYLDKLGEKHDTLVHGWKQSILEAKTAEPQVRSVLQFIISVCPVFWQAFTIQVVGRCGHTNSDMAEY